MSQVSVTQDINASADAVWAYVGDFNGLSRWHPGIAESVLEDGGSKRRLTLGDGAELLEEARERDEAGMSYSYAILESPLPIQNYVSTFKVTSAGDGCEVTWFSSFDTTGDEDEMIGLIRGIYEGGLDNLKAIVEG